MSIHNRFSIIYIAFLIIAMIVGPPIAILPVFFAATIAIMLIILAINEDQGLMAFIWCLNLFLCVFNIFHWAQA